MRNPPDVNGKIGSESARGESGLHENLAFVYAAIRALSSQMIEGAERQISFAAYRRTLKTKMQLFGKQTREIFFGLAIERAKSIETDLFPTVTSVGMYLICRFLEWLNDPGFHGQIDYKLLKY